jgi:putative ATP-dependent endonuclease of OLD family
MRIQIWFHPNPDNIDTIFLECPPEDEGKFQTSFRYVNGYKDQFLSNQVRDKCALVYLDAGRNFDAQFSQSRWSLFGKIIRQLDEHFRNEIPTEVHRQVKEHLLSAQELLKTPLYRQFERTITEAFEEQLRQTTHRVTFDFRTFDPLNFYRSLSPILFEGGREKNPSEAGSGMRNLIVLALFRAYAQTFKGNAIIAIEEPEIYLHPHAQRSLASLLQQLANSGNQIIFSTHSATFIDVARSDRIALIDQGPDEEGELCTSVRTVSHSQLLEKRQQLHSSVSMTLGGMRARYQNIWQAEHAEAFFAKLVVLVEGPTEKEALSVYARYLNLDLDANGVSIVGASGKNNLDQLYQLYDAHQIPIYLIFDNDLGGRPDEVACNKVLLRMLGQVEETMPAAVVCDRYAIINGNYERAIKADLEQEYDGLFDRLHGCALEELGSRAGKALIARHMARALVELCIVPNTVRSIINEVKRRLKLETDDEPPDASNDPRDNYELLDEDFPF